MGDSKRAAEEVKRKLEENLTLGEFAIMADNPTVPTLWRWGMRLRTFSSPQILGVAAVYPESAVC